MSRPEHIGPPPFADPGRRTIARDFLDTAFGGMLDNAKVEATGTASKSTPSAGLMVPVALSAQGTRG